VDQTNQTTVSLGYPNNFNPPAFLVVAEVNDTRLLQIDDFPDKWRFRYAGGHTAFMVLPVCALHA
jgi:hypothetical protein